MISGLKIYAPIFRSSISDKEIDSFRDAEQQYSDCYLMTTLETLSHTENGRKILKKHIHHDDQDSSKINCYLYNPDGKLLRYRVPSDKAVKGYEKLFEKQTNNIIRSVDISVGEYEKKYKAKPWICRVTDDFKTYTFENNLPSHFMEIFTGKKPTVNIAETDFNIDLTSYKDEVMKVFERADKEKKHNLVIATGLKPMDGRTWHVYILEDVNLKNNTITVKEKRLNTPKTISIDEALTRFKYIVGYFDNDLA